MSERICPQCHLETDARVCPEDGFPTVLSAPFRPGATDPLVGTLVDERYRIEGRLGQGGMGVVYRAVQVSVDRPVALKLLRRDLVSNLTDIARFQKEARAVAALRHPNTVRLFDFGQADAGNLYLVLECLTGESLAELIAREAPLSPARVVTLATQIVESLAEAHAVGIVHRDLKPENLFVAQIFGKRDFVKVLDFGVAKMLEEVDAGVSLTGTGVAIGSPRYMAPEQACSESVTTSADLYALGGILYEMLTGAPVFPYALPMECLIAHMKESPPPLRVRGQVVGGPLVDLVMSCLSKLPSGRPESAEVMLEALRDMPAVDQELVSPTAVGREVARASHDHTTVDLTNAAHLPTLDLMALREAATLNVARGPDGALATTLVERSAPAHGATAPPRPLRLLGMGVAAMSVLVLVWWTQRGSSGTAPVDIGALMRVPPSTPEEGGQQVTPSVLRPVPGRTVIHTVPRGARVLDDRTMMGRTPLTIVWDPQGRSPDLKLELRGYHTARLNLDGDPVLEHVVHLQKLDEVPPPSPMGEP